MRISKAPDERKQEIVEAAARLFLSKGFEAISMQDIADEVGVVKGLCYRYFPSKQALFDACLERLTDSFITGIADLFADSELPVEERFRRAIESWWGNYERIRAPLAGSLQPQGREQMHDLIALRGYRYLAEKMEVFIQDGCKQGMFHVENPKARARFIIFGIYGMRHMDISATDYFSELFDCMGWLLEADIGALLPGFVANRRSEHESQDGV